MTIDSLYRGCILQYSKTLYCRDASHNTLIILPTQFLIIFNILKMKLIILHMQLILIQIHF